MRGERIVWILVSISLLIFMGVYAIHGWTEACTRLNIRLSARFAFLSFWMAFIASAIQYFLRNKFGFWIITNRKFFGISFGIIHLIHFFFLVLLQFSFHPVFEMAEPIELLGGGGAYLFVVIMLITSIESVKTKMSFRVWKGIHTFGMYWIASVFLSSYGSRSITEWEYRPLLILLLFAFGLRFFKLFKSETALTRR